VAALLARNIELSNAGGHGGPPLQLLCFGLSILEVS
jgi:hypothetical protein